MALYPQERKEAVLNKLLPPHNMTVTAVARSEGLSYQTCITGEIKSEKKVTQCQVKH